MKPVDFIQSRLENIANAFPQVHIKYAFNNIILTHIIELLPLSEYQNNSALDDAWIPLSFEFRNIFPKEEIAFVSSDSTLSIHTPAFEFNVPQIELAEIDKIFAELTEGEMSYTFPTCIPARIMTFSTSVSKVMRCPEQKLNTEIDDFENLYQQAA